MIFSKIFKIFLMFLLLGVIPQALSGSSYHLNEHTDVVFSPTAEIFAMTVMEYLREADTHLKKFFPQKKKIEKSELRKFRINISDEPGKAMTVLQKGKNITVDIGGITPAFQSDYNFLHRIFSAAALQVMPYENEEVRTKWRLPHWISMALHAKIKNSFSGEKILRSSRMIPGIRVFLQKNYYPDPLLIERMSAENMSNIEFFFLQDYCRLLVDICSMYSQKGSNVTGTYLRELYLENVTYDQAIFQRVIMYFLQNHAELHLLRMLDDPSKYNEKQQLEYFLKFHAKHFAFSYGYPAPVSYLKQYFKELQQVRFAKLGPDNKPDGNIIESSIDRFPELIRQYPYVENVIRLKKGEILHFRSIASSFFSDEINRLIELIGNVQDSWLFGTSGKEIQQAIRDIEKKLQEFESVEAYLEKIESENLSPFQVFPYEFSVEKEHRNVTVPASVLKKLDEAEKSYLK